MGIFDIENQFDSKITLRWLLENGYHSWNIDETFAKSIYINIGRGYKYFRIYYYPSTRSVKIVDITTGHRPLQIYENIIYVEELNHILNSSNLLQLLEKD